ncbi:MAG: carboxylesterase [Betaproteobacteria bacterium RBG_16_56_24]|nr:MAG: carboxylesterase [Betaproteobacteria bacterium RBG_16_56_24]
MPDNPAPIILESGKQPRHSIIWLHGLGADGHDFVPIAGELNLPVAVRYIFPHAPMRPVTINGGFVMRAWYDIAGPSIPVLSGAEGSAQQDEQGIRASQAAIEALIAREISNGIAPGNIFLAGFSQGGAIALHTALRRSLPLGGVLALSTYLPLAGSVPDEMQTNSRATPIFMAHGLDDPVVPYSLGAASRDALMDFGYAVTWRDYAMEHSVCEEELRDIETWLGKRIED